MLPSPSSHARRPVPPLLRPNLTNRCFGHRRPDYLCGNCGFVIAASMGPAQRDYRRGDPLRLRSRKRVPCSLAGMTASGGALTAKVNIASLKCQRHTLTPRQPTASSRQTTGRSVSRSLSPAVIRPGSVRSKPKPTPRRGSTHIGPGERPNGAGRWFRRSSGLRR